MVVVTAATDNYFRRLQDLIGSIHQFDGDTPVYVYDIGLRQAQVSELLRYKNVNYRRFDYDKYPPFIRKRAAPLAPDYQRATNGGMRQAIKLLVLAELMDEIPNPVLWLDAGSHIERSLDPVREYLGKHGYFFTCMSRGPHMRKYTHVKTLKFLGKPEYKRFLGHTSTGSMGFGGRASWSYRAIAVPARDCVLNKACIEPRGASLRNHRYDASVISALLQMNGIAVTCTEHRENYCTDTVPCWNTSMPVTRPYVIYHSRGNTVDPDRPEQFRFRIQCLDAQSARHVREGYDASP